MRCQAEYFDLKLDGATQLLNGTPGSKYSAHHSRSSVLLTLLSYLIPTVRKKNTNKISLVLLCCFLTGESCKNTVSYYAQQKLVS